MFPGDFPEFSNQLYFVGKEPYEKCQMSLLKNTAEKQL